MSDSRKMIFLSITVFVFVFAISFLLYSFERKDRINRYFFFPDKISQKLVGEERQIAKRATLQEDINEYLDELLLGPGNPYSSSLFPLNTRIYSVLLDHKTIYINFTKEFLFQSSKNQIPYNLIYKAIFNNILYNFRSFKDIKISVIGRQPYVFSPDSIQTKSSLSRTRYSKDILF